MGNICFMKKQEPRLKYKDLVELNQITTQYNGDCDICKKNKVEGFESKSVINDERIFVCLNCKNLK